MSTVPRTHVFIEEVGKTSVEELVNPLQIDELAQVAPGEQLQLSIEGRRLYVLDANGKRLGEIQTKVAERVVELQLGGNRYEVYALGLAAGSLRVILREVYRDPSRSRKYLSQERSRRPARICVSARPSAFATSPTSSWATTTTTTTSPSSTRRRTGVERARRRPVR
jgi:hypothetical protein